MTLREYIETRQISPAVFAAELGVPPSTVTRWLKGERTPVLESIAAIEKATGGLVTMADFLSPPPSQREDAA